MAPRREGDDIVAQLAVGDAAFWVARAGADMNRFCPTAIRGTTARFLLVVDNPDAIMITAVAAGGIESSPVSAYEPLTARTAVRTASRQLPSE